MEINIENRGPYHSAWLYGKLDSRGAASIYDAVVGLGSLGPGKVILHLGAVTDVTRAGCRAIFVAAKILNAKTGAKLVVCEASPKVQSVLLGAGCDHLIQVHAYSVCGGQMAA